MKLPFQLDRELLDRPARGMNLNPGTFGEQLGTGQTLLVFLRHFG